MSNTWPHGHETYMATKWRLMGSHMVTGVTRPKNFGFNLMIRKNIYLRKKKLYFFQFWKLKNNSHQNWDLFSIRFRSDSSCMVTISI